MVRPKKPPLTSPRKRRLVAHGQGFLLRGVEAEKAQRARVRAIVHHHQQLAARFVGNLARHHGGLDLRHIALARVGQAHEARLVLIAQGQVQGQINVAVQPELAQRFLRCGEGFVVRRSTQAWRLAWRESWDNCASVI